MRAPLFVAYEGTRKGRGSKGFRVLDCPSITTGRDIETLVSKLEVHLGYDSGSLIILNFRRLETDEPVVTLQ